MYRLMLVDDEPQIREGLKEMVDWETCGFQLVAEAGNGLDALQLAEQTRPDLVITDVRMHFMDGLEMIERMRSFLPMTQFVVVSGYDEFKYTRKSIQIRISDYVLKPISAQEFTAVLERAKRALDEEHKKRNSVQLMNRIFSDSLPILREQLLYTIMSGGVEELSLRSAAARYGLSLEADRYVVALMRISSSGDTALAGDEELVRLAVDRVVREILTERISCHVFHYSGRIAVLAMLRAEQSMSELLELIETAATVVREYLGASAAAGVGEPMNHLSGVPQSAAQALCALNHLALVDDGQVIYIQDLKPRSGARLAVDPQELMQLSAAIRSRLEPEIAQCVRALIKRLRGAQISFDEYQVYILEILLAVIRDARDMQVSLDFRSGESGSLIRDFIEPHELDEVEGMLISLCGEVANGIEANRRESGAHIAQQALELIARSYGEPTLTIDRVCEQINVSPAYLRTLFRRETGQTFHQHLTGFRMNRANELLRTSALKTWEVAQRCGLGDASYFSYSFKKYFGFSPSQARKDPKQKARKRQPAILEEETS